VGSFSDPKNIPGMAHFLEHMVFMGSEKFPQENDFDSFISVIVQTVAVIFTQLFNSRKEADPTTPQQTVKSLHFILSV
jgi:predicted Zn-dependent peptidase